VGVTTVSRRVERRGALCDLEVGHVTLQELVLEREQLLAIGRHGGLGPRRQRQHQRIHVRNPAKARRREPRTHGDPVREQHLRADLVKHPRGELVALFLGDTLHRAAQLLHVRVAHVGVWVLVEGLVGGEPVRVVWPQLRRYLERKDHLERQRVLIRIAGSDAVCMAVVVHCPNLPDERDDLRVRSRCCAVMGGRPAAHLRAATREQEKYYDRVRSHKLSSPLG
jgi:hypothetical protein